MPWSQIYDSILRNMEALIVGCRGGFRPHLRALHFGGAAKLARELTNFLNSGAIHRDKFGEESCLPYLRSLYCPINGHLLKAEWRETKDIIDWFVDMIVDATLSGALVAITSDLSKLVDHYEPDAPILCQTSVQRVIRGAKCLDEMDADSLAEIQLSGITDSLTPPSSRDYSSFGGSITVKIPKQKQCKSPKLAATKVRSNSISTQTVLSSTDRQIKPEAEKRVNGRQIRPEILKEVNIPIRTPSPSLDSSRQLSSSCPSMTEIGFRRFLISRNWSLPEDEPDRTSPNFEVFQQPLLSLNSEIFQQPLASSVTNGQENNVANLGARPKLKNHILPEFESLNLSTSNGITSSGDTSNGFDESQEKLIKNTVPAYNDSEKPKTIADSSVIYEVVKVESKAKRRTHRRSASDTDVNKTTLVNSFPPKNKIQSNKIVELNEEDFVEGYEEGPSCPSYQMFPSWMSTSTCGSWSELRPPSGGWQFPKPAFKEQSLFNYIISGQFSKHQAPLDQDNAHLILAEAVINSSSTGNNFKALGSICGPTSDLSSDDVTGGSLSSELSSRNKDNRSSIRSRSDDSGQPKDDNFDDISETNVGDLSLTDSIYDVHEQEQGRGEEGREAVVQNALVKRTANRFVLHDGSPLRERSAEATALQLLLNLKNPHQPKASELRYLVSEQDAPRGLLPLPPRFVAFSSDTVPNNNSSSNIYDNVDNNAVENFGNQNDENQEDDFGNSTELRGTIFWAPPRPQLILKIHKKQSNIKEAMIEQSYFCHDCGMKVDRAFIHTFRFCYYFGKYSCTTCHSNKTHVLPANIIHKWDFKEYRVSDFALNVLQRLSPDPLFAVRDLNPDLTRKIGKLRTAISLREQAVKVTRYLVTCRFAKSLILELDDCINIVDPDVLSLDDLAAIRTGAYAKNLKRQIDMATSHVLQCELCCARGFLCEGCHSGDPLFPFQLDDVIQCQDCHSCYHKKCVKLPCSKCLRMKNR